MNCFFCVIDITEWTIMCQDCHHCFTDHDPAGFVICADRKGYKLHCCDMRYVFHCANSQLDSREVNNFLNDHNVSSRS